MKTNRHRPIIIAIAAAVLLSAAGEFLFVSKREAYFVGSDFPMFWVGFGFASCIAIVVVSKWVGHTFLMREDDPYTGEHVEAEPPPEEGEAEGPVPAAGGAIASSKEDGDA